MWDVWSEVEAAARGTKAAYRLNGSALGRGGQATVSRGIHRLSGASIAFKRLLPGLEGSEDAKARMRREIEVGRSVRHTNAVPVLDADADSKWFVMPLADAVLDAERDELSADEDQLLRVVTQVASGLAAAHDDGWTHRDVKPANILRFDLDGVERWAVADWGLGRGPVGTTTFPGRTQVGVAYGTEGFAAPELSVNAHGAQAPADVFSLGQVIGWLLTSRSPLPNVPLLPDDGPWREVVRECTRHDPGDRPQTMREFLELVDAELAPLPDPPTAQAEQFLTRARSGDHQAAVLLLRMAERNPDDFDLFEDVISRVDAESIKFLATQYTELLRNALVLIKSVGDGRSFIDFATVERFQHVAIRAFVAACRRGDSDLAATAFDAYCTWDDGYDQWGPKKALRPALTEARGDVAQAAARVLRRHRETAQHLADLADDKRIDRAIRGVISEALR